MQDSHSDPSASRQAVRKSTVVIVALWVWFLADSAWSALTFRPDEFTKGISLWFGLAMVVLPATVFTLATIRAKTSPFFHAGLARWIGARAGEGATADFLRRWRPLLFFGTAGAIDALILAARFVRAGNATHEWWLVGFMSSGAATFTLSHVILKRRSVPGM